jgi:ligand-binding SRPBCC domain-containing protein
LARIERSARFNAPLSEVFDFIADFRTLTEYNPSVLHVNPLTPGPPRRGSRFELTLTMFGMKLRPVLTITEFRSHASISTHLDAFLPAREKRTFRADDGGTTLFFFTIEFASGWPLLGPLTDRVLVKAFAERQADTEIRLLKEKFGFDR